MTEVRTQANPWAGQSPSTGCKSSLESPACFPAWHRIRGAPVQGGALPRGSSPHTRGLGKPLVELPLPAQIRATPGSSAHPCPGLGTAEASGSGRREG